MTMNNDELREEFPRLKRVNEYQVSIGNEDHTLMNILRYSINKKCEDVEYCGYTIPHPSEQISLFNVQFRESYKQNSENVYAALIEGLKGVEMIGKRLLEEIENFNK